MRKSLRINSTQSEPSRILQNTEAPKLFATQSIPAATTATMVFHTSSPSSPPITRSKKNRFNFAASGNIDFSRSNNSMCMGLIDIAADDQPTVLTATKMDRTTSSSKIDQHFTKVLLGNPSQCSVTSPSLNVISTTNQETPSGTIQTDSSGGIDLVDRSLNNKTESKMGSGCRTKRKLSYNKSVIPETTESKSTSMLNSSLVCGSSRDIHEYFDKPLELIDMKTVSSKSCNEKIQDSRKVEPIKINLNRDIAKKRTHRQNEKYIHDKVDNKNCNQPDKQRIDSELLLSSPKSTTTLSCHNFEIMSHDDNNFANSEILDAQTYSEAHILPKLTIRTSDCGNVTGCCDVTHSVVPKLTIKMDGCNSPNVSHKEKEPTNVFDNVYFNASFSKLKSKPNHNVKSQASTQLPQKSSAVSTSSDYSLFDFSSDIRSSQKSDVHQVPRKMAVKTSSKFSPVVACTSYLSPPTENGANSLTIPKLTIKTIPTLSPSRSPISISDNVIENFMDIDASARKESTAGSSDGYLSRKFFTRKAEDYAGSKGIPKLTIRTNKESMGSKSATCPEAFPKFIVKSVTGDKVQSIPKLTISLNDYCSTKTETDSSLSFMEPIHTHFTDADNLEQSSENVHSAPSDPSYSEFNEKVPKITIKQRQTVEIDNKKLVVVQDRQHVNKIPKIMIKHMPVREITSNNKYEGCPNSINVTVDRNFRTENNSGHVPKIVIKSMKTPFPASNSDGDGNTETKTALHRRNRLRVPVFLKQSSEVNATKTNAVNKVPRIHIKTVINSDVSKTNFMYKPETDKDLDTKANNILPSENDPETVPYEVKPRAYIEREDLACSAFPSFACEQSKDVLMPCPMDIDESCSGVEAVEGSRKRETEDLERFDGDNKTHKLRHQEYALKHKALEHHSEIITSTGSTDQPPLHICDNSDSILESGVFRQHSKQKHTSFSTENKSRDNLISTYGFPHLSCPILDIPHLTHALVNDKFKEGSPTECQNSFNRIDLKTDLKIYNCELNLKKNVNEIACPIDLNIMKSELSDFDKFCSNPDDSGWTNASHEIIEIVDDIDKKDCENNSFTFKSNDTAIRKNYILQNSSSVKFSENTNNFDAWGTTFTKPVDQNISENSTVHSILSNSRIDTRDVSLKHYKSSDYLSAFRKRIIEAALIRQLGSAKIRKQCENVENQKSLNLSSNYDTLGPTKSIHDLPIYMNTHFPDADDDVNESLSSKAKNTILQLSSKYSANKAAKLNLTGSINIDSKQFKLSNDCEISLNAQFYSEKDNKNSVLCHFNVGSGTSFETQNNMHINLRNMLSPSKTENKGLKTGIFMNGKNQILLENSDCSVLNVHDEINLNSNQLYEYDSEPKNELNGSKRNGNFRSTSGKRPRGRPRKDGQPAGSVKKNISEQKCQQDCSRNDVSLEHQNSQSKSISPIQRSLNDCNVVSMKHLYYTKRYVQRGARRGFRSGAITGKRFCGGSRPRCIGGLQHSPELFRESFTLSPDQRQNVKLERKKTLEVFEEDTRMSADSSNIRARHLDMLNNDDTQSSALSNFSFGDGINSLMKKRPKMEVIAPEGISEYRVDMIAEYDWPPPKGCCPARNRDTFMIQEQIAQYLGIKSFKRKYPDLPRRQIDMEERNWLQEKGLVTEKMCDLGITAVWASDVLDIMCIDFYDKYEEYKSYLRRKQVRNTEARQRAIAAEAVDRSLQARERAVESVAKWNSSLNKSRKENRRECVDLQSLTINVPDLVKKKLIRMKKLHSTSNPNYPIALVPGQFSEYYKVYSSDELRFYPINTVTENPQLPKHKIFHKDGEQNSDSDNNSYWTDADDSSNSDLNSSSQFSNSDSSSSSDEEDASSTIYKCSVCLQNQNKNLFGYPEAFIICCVCHKRSHPSCIEMPSRMVSRVRNYSWQCAECKFCAKCKKKRDESKMLYCEQCDRGYHIYCIRIKNIPEGRWHCDFCAICVLCGSDKPEGNNSIILKLSPSVQKSCRYKKAKWTHEYRIDHITKLREHCSTLCAACVRTLGNNCR